jgi:hypothetical protein
LRRGTTDWTILQQNFTVTFSFEHENPNIDLTLKQIRGVIFIKEPRVELMTEDQQHSRQTVKELLSWYQWKFIKGYATRYYRKFIKGYSQITAPMEKLLRKDSKFQWNEDCQRGLDTLKEKMVTAPILVFLDWENTFHMHVDASTISLGVILAQPGIGELDHPIEFASRKLSESEQNYNTTEREGLAMVYALQKFKHYLLGKHFKMFTDHSTLKYLVNKPVLGGENLSMVIAVPRI